MGQWYVEPSSVRLDLGDGAWIDVKRELTYGDEQELQACALHLDAQAGTPSMELDWAAFTVEKIYRWMTDWSAVDAKGAKVPITRDAIRALPGKLGKRIEQAIDAHGAEMEQEKN